jgi:hypothetical protein
LNSFAALHSSLQVRDCKSLRIAHQAGTEFAIRSP